LLPYFDFEFCVLLPKFIPDKRDQTGNGGALIKLRSVGWIALYLFFTIWYASHTIHAVADSRSVCKKEQYKEVKIKEKEENMMIEIQDSKNYTVIKPQHQDAKPQCYFI